MVVNRVLGARVEGAGVEVAVVAGLVLREQTCYEVVW